MFKNKSKRINIGSIVKSRDPSKSDYIKLNLGYVGGSITLTDGQTLSVETKAFQKNSANAAIQAGKLSEESGEAVLSRIEKIPDFVRAEIFVFNKED